MERLVDWYWEHGIMRGNDPTDPDCELRKISIGGWLDPVVRILERNRSILANASSSKACLALWGPSQSGKSTMMSRYIDGRLDDGFDSALTWSEDHKTRFSIPADGVAAVPAETLIFNPFNHNSDASGLATRYTLKSEDDKEINKDFPIEVKFTTRAQIIQSLSLGYLSECERDDTIRFSSSDLLGKIQNKSRTNPAKRDAFMLVKDIANVIECMKGDDRFRLMFKKKEKDEWSATRKELMSSPILLSNEAAAEDFLADIFWDSDKRLTVFYKGAETLLNALKRSWKGCRVLASMEVGALLLDIDSYASFCDPGRNVEKDTRQKIAGLSYERVGNEVHIFVAPNGSGSPEISGKAFGLFQAICAELVVPLRREKLRNKEAFVKLTEKCDILDFPGVSNNNPGTIQENIVKLNLKDISDYEICTKVFKQGKTQCFVYSYVKSYGIDAFAILVRTDSYPSQASVLNAGVIEWMRSFMADWTPGDPFNDMQIFVNQTFYASLINNVALNGIGNTLTPYCERLAKLQFARPNTATFFATTYPQYPIGRIINPEHADDVISAIRQDTLYMAATGLTEENLRAVFGPDGGQDYMLQSISDSIDRTNSLRICRRILHEDLEAILKLLVDHLPLQAPGGLNARSALLKECVRAINDAIAAMPEDNDAPLIELADTLESLFSVINTIFEQIPQNASLLRANDPELVSYVRRQIARWYNDRNANAMTCSVITSNHKSAVIAALRDFIGEDASISELVKLIRTQLGGVSKATAVAATYPFSLAFSNLLRYGSITVDSDARIGEMNPSVLNDFIQIRAIPHRYAVIDILKERIDVLSNIVNVGTRPPQPGDEELQSLYNEFKQSNQFAI